MNLIPHLDIDYPLLHYRYYQYTLIPELIQICFNYVKQFKLQFDDIHIMISDNITYNSVNHFNLKTITVKLNDDTSNFLVIDIPTLIDKTFFHLNGSNYIPVIYIIDHPIIIKANSIELQTLFNKIYIYPSNDIVSWNNKSFNYSSLLQFYNTGIFNSDLNTVFNCSSEQFDSVINSIFFDEWTSRLYSTIYKIPNITFKDVINIIVNNSQVQHYTDLTYKRLSFIELLLQPLFTSIGEYLFSNKYTTFPIKKNSIITHFFSSNESNIKLSKTKRSIGLSGKNLYTLSNGFSGILLTKATFKSSLISYNNTNIYSKLHTSHKGRICPITISSKKPGNVVSLVLDQDIDIRYGLFK